MLLPRKSIERPVLTVVGTIAILLLGWIGYRNLAVRELPDIEYPIVSVQTVLPGAAPEVVETEVTEVLEEEINTIEGIKTLTSISGEQTSVITAEFELSRNVDLALQDVRTVISRIRGELPDDVDEPIVQKLDPDARAIIWISVSNPDVDLTEVNEVADNLVKDRIETLPGVGSIILGGEQRFAVRIRLDARAMAAYDITVSDVRRALQTGNVSIPSGRIESESREFTVRTEGELPTPEAFNDLIVAYRESAPITLGQVGHAEAGVENERTLARFNGKPTVGVGVVKQSDANTVAVAERVLSELDEIREDLPPGYTALVAVNSAEFIEQSVAEVEETLFIAFALVVVVILLFLQSWRATVIPALAIPVSIVGTFAAFHLLGFSINTLTLLALVLAIGIVVDDAIVVVENIHRHMEEGADARTAAEEGTSEIAFAVIAISLTLVIVFLPIAFISGIVGRLFREFGVGVAAAVLISAFIALTLTPMLSSRFLKRGHGQNRVFRAVESFLAWITDRYRATLRWAVGHRGLVAALAVGTFALAILLMMRLPSEFVPPEDRGQFIVSVSAPQGSTLDYTDSYLQQVEDILSNTEGVQGFFTAIGLGFGGPATVNEAIAFVQLDDHADRGQFEIMDEVRGRVAGLAGVDVYLIAPSSLNQGFEQPLQFVLQASDLDELAEYADSLVAIGRGMGTLQAVDSNLDINKPELSVTIDRAKAASLGVSVAEVASTLRVLLGGADLSEYERGNERYEVVAQLTDSLRASPQDLRSVYVRGEDGQLVQLSNVVNVVEGVGPSQINHFGRLRSATVSATPVGVSLGQALDDVNSSADSILPASFRTTVSGQSQDFRESAASLLFALFMAVIAIYLVLAAQFESFVHPLTIMLALPLALVGAVVLLAIFGMTLNIYSMIGIIMLMGLVTKNSILLVDYTNLLRRQGEDIVEAVIEAGAVRLRPILMTSFSIVIGVAPIALALGAGAGSRRPLGTAVIGGMITSTALTLLVVPVFYLLLNSGAEWMVDRARAVRDRVASRFAHGQATEEGQ